VFRSFARRWLKRSGLVWVPVVFEVLRKTGKNPQNPQWDRWGPKENPRGPQSWNRARNLSWKLKPTLGKAEQQEGLLSPS
jgi:hypothetical protein